MHFATRPIGSTRAAPVTQDITMTVKTYIAAALFALCTTGASAASTYQVDALDQCLDFSTGFTPGFVTVPVKAGTYKITVESSTVVFSPALPDSIHSVVGVIQDLNMAGFVSLDKSLIVTSTAAGSLRLVITDSQCDDNSGSTVVKVRKLR